MDNYPAGVTEVHREDPPQKRNILDYLHLYLGCGVETNIQGQMFQQYGALKIDKLTVTDLNFIHDALERQERYNGPTIYHIKLKLRPLADMTSDEIIEVARITSALPVGWFEPKHYEVRYVGHPNTGIEVCVSNKYAVRVTFKGEIYFHNYTNPNAAIYLPMTPSIIVYLLKQGFDLFGLISDGLAIDKSELEK
jgi:hypothetical protein